MVIPYSDIKAILMKENDGDPRECKLICGSGKRSLTFSSLYLKNFFLANVYSALVTFLSKLFIMIMDYF